MHDFKIIEENFKKFISNIRYWIPEDIYCVNLNLLHHYDLLHFYPFYKENESKLTRFFQIFESSEKITLINDEFVIWIKPDFLDHVPVTYTLIALNKGNEELHLETAFISSGVYNNTKLVLRVLEKFLLEIQETNNLLSNFGSVA